MATFMIALSRVLGVSWRKSQEGYNLFQTAEQIKAETAKRRDSEMREQRYIESQGIKLRAQVDAALQQKGPGRDIFADLLGSFDANTIDAGIASALEDEAFLSGTDQSHLHNHFLSATPFSNLPQSQQQSVRQIAQEGGFTHLDAGSSVGHIAAAGGFRLGIVEPDGKDVWVAPQHSIGQVNTVNPAESENDFDPTAVELLKSNRLVDFGILRNTLRQKGINSNKGTDRSRLAAQMQDIAAQTDVDFLSDCYLNSAQTAHIYEPDPAWTAEDALTWIARTFGHKMTYHGGLLEVATVTEGLDLRLEAPAAVLNSLDAQVKSGRLPTREDLIVLSACTREQLQILVKRHPIMRGTQTGHLLQALRSYPFLQFYGSLSAEQQAKALSDAGVFVGDLSLKQQRLFERLLTIGLPKKTPDRLKLGRNRFCLKSGILTL